MDADAFWQAIEQCRGDEQSERLVAILAEHEPDDILAFHKHFAHRVHEAYRFDLMAVANIINGGFSGEDYDAFVGWLILQGRAYFEAALKDAARAADRAEQGKAKSRALWSVPSAAYAKRTGRDDFDIEAQPISLVMEGERMSDDRVRTRFAELVQRFNWSPAAPP